jgi:hypothetical protein
MSLRKLSTTQIWKSTQTTFAAPLCHYYVVRLNKYKLSRPIYSICITRNIIVAQVYLREISEWNINKSGNRLYIYAPKVE